LFVESQIQLHFFLIALFSPLTLNDLKGFAKKNCVFSFDRGAENWQTASFPSAINYCN
jgi:hypothetical protein